MINNHSLKTFLFSFDFISRSPNGELNMSSFPKFRQFPADHLRGFYAQIRRQSFPLAHIELSEKASSELGFQTAERPTQSPKLHDSAIYTILYYTIYI